LYSQSFDNAYWNKANATITAGVDIAPDGTQTMQLYVPNNGATIGAGTYLSKGITLSAGNIAISIYAKAKELTTFVLQDGSGQGSQFNVSTGVIVGNIGSGIGSITLVGNGVYRCVVTIASAGANPNYFFYPSAGTANGYNGIYIWGAQLEALAVPTSYIPTTSAQVTRAADVPPLPTSGWFNSSQGTFYTEIIPLYTIGTNRIQTISSNVSSLIQYLNNSTGALQTFDGTNFALTSNVATSNSLNKLATTYSTVSNSLSSCLNGSTVASSSAYNNAFANATNIWIGTSSGALNGRIKKLAYYPQALTSAQLQSLTGS
jgi:hypothetical protein